MIEDDYTIRRRADGEAIGQLVVHEKHAIDPQHLAYHRERFDLKAPPARHQPKD